MQNNSNRTFYQLAAAANQRVKEKDYWVSKLSGDYIKSYFPYDYNMRSIVESQHRLEAAAFVLSPELSSTLINFSRHSDIRLYITLAAGLNALLYQYMTMDINVITIADIDTDVVVGMPILKSEVEIDFINTLLVLRTSINPSITFKELVMKTRQTIIEAIENQNYPIEILARDLNMTSTSGGDFPLLDVALLLENLHDRTYLNHVNLNMIFSLTRCESSIHGRLEYNPLLYRETTIKQIINQFIFLFREVVSNMDTPFCKIEMISEEEKKRILVDFNDTTKEYPRDKTICELFAKQAERFPGHTAVIGIECGKESVDPVGAQDIVPVSMDHVSITYSELNEKSNRLASFLRERGVKPDSVVAIMVARSVEMIIGILGILKAGGAYLPIDPDYLQESIDYMLKESEAKILLSEASKVCEASGGTEVIDLPSLIVKNQDAEPTHLTHLIHPTQLCYIIFTSNSTFRSKGVMVEHRNLIAYTYSFLHEFDLGPGDIVLQQASFSYDAFVEEVYPILLRGGRLAIPGKDMILDIDRLSEFVLKNRVNIVDCSPLLLDRLNQLDYLINLNGIHTFISGGGVLKGEFIDSLLKIGTVYNTYGPTETTVCTAYFKCSKEMQGNIPIGKPIANYNVYILDRIYRLIPLGVPGELCISGVGVTRGYLNRPELTAEKFDYDLWDFQDSQDKKKYQKFFGWARGAILQKSPSGRRRLYKTGDLARWMPDGNIEFLGRFDEQVKIRGVRIELGEIEDRLLKHKKVKETVVVVKDGNGGDQHLCAYIIPFNVDTIQGLESELWDYLSEELLDYMVPAYIVILEKMPLSPGGKVDRKALPDPNVISGRNYEPYVPPINESEKMMVDIWSEVLGLDSGKIGVNDNFFQLGGHSLKAANLVGRIFKTFSVDIPLERLFTIPTIRAICLFIDKTAVSRYSSIEPVEEKEYYPLSSAQKRLYILQQMDENGHGQGTAYNIPIMYPVEGPIEKDRLKSTFIQLIKRHDSLRTSFHKIEEEPVQRINDKVDFEIEYNDKKLPTDFIRPFDLSKASLLRVGLIEAGEEKHILMIDIHHIVSDGLSSGVLATDFADFYFGKHLPNLKLQYKDFAQWQNNLKQDITIKKQQRYWQEQFPEDIPVLDLPHDYLRPMIQSFEGRTIDFGIGKEETSALKWIAREEGGTLYMVLLAVINIFLAKLTNQEDIIIGTPIAGRRHADLERIIGMFVNTLVLRNFPNGGKSFSRLLEEVITRTLEAFENQDYQFEDLVETLVVERDASRQPLFDVMFVLQDSDLDGGDRTGQTSSDNWDMKINGHPFESNISKFDLTFYCLERGGQLWFSFQYCTKLFKAVTIARFIDYFKNIVSNVTVDREIKLYEIDILSEQEKQQLLFDFNDTEAMYPVEKTIVDLFGEQVNKVPFHIALVYEDQQVDYRKLDERANRLADVLVEKGVKPGSIVGIMVGRSTEMIIGILGILKAGAAYLPIDPDYPPERLDYMLKDSNARVLVKKSEIRISKSEINSNDQNKISTPIVLDFEHLNFEFVSNFEFRASNLRPLDLAYVIYTSGTTGSPKGTLIEHRNVVRLMVNDKFHFDFNDQDIWSLFHSYCFDFSIWEMYGALLYGGKLVLIPRMAARDTAVFLNLLKEEKVTVLNQTPSSFYRLVEEEVREGNRDLNLRYVIFGGEALSPMKLREWKLKYPGVKLVNMFGITETTVHVTFKEIGEKEIAANISNIGKPIPMLKTFILDSGLRLVPQGTAGELYVAGAGVARGYLNQPEFTSEKFDHDLWDYQDYHDEKRKRNYHKFFGGSRGASLQKSFSGRRRQKIYRSGDMARFIRESNGDLEYLGRIDHQVKIRGFRIELGEIESRLLMHDKVKDAFVLAKEDAHGDRYLCAFCVPGDGKVARIELRGYLSTVLPDYMVPSYFVFLEEIPLTPNGKVDRMALPEPEMESGQTYTAPRGEFETKLVVIWGKVLNRQEHESIGIDDNFFELGGHSLKAAALISKIHKELNIRIPLTEIFMTPTIRGLAQYLKQSARDKYLAIEPLEYKEYHSLSSAQKRLYFLQQLAPNSTGYNMTFVLPVSKKIEKNKIESTLKQLIARHESLRTSFVKVNDEPVQWVHEEVEFEIEYFAAKNAKDHEGLVSNIIRPFDLSQAPLLRSGLIKTREGNHIWVVDMHHIISDGTSMVILQEDFESLYSGEVLSELNIQYKDFSEWQNRLFERGVIKSQENYWLNLYRDSSEIPRLDMPMDNRRPKVFTFAGNYYNFILEREDAVKFKALAVGNNGTLYMNILAVLNTLFYKYTSQSDIIIGTGIAGRPHADLQGVIGMFVNTLAMRNYPQDEKPYESFLQEVITNSVNAFENQDMQFEELVDRLQLERDTSRNPLFDMMMVVQNFRRLNRPVDVLSLSTPEKNLPIIDYTYTTSKFDMTFFVQEEGEDVYISIEYYTAIFKKETITRFARHLKKVIKEVVFDPGIQLAEIDILTEQEREDILYRFNNTVSVYPIGRGFCELFEEQVEQTPDAVAVIGQGIGVQGSVPVLLDHVSITYKKLNEKSNQLTSFLYYEKHIRTEERVGILMDKSVERILAVLGVLKTGAGYVPIDPSLPEERIRSMIDDAHIEVLISQKRYIRTLNRLQWECNSFHTFICMDSWDIFSEDEEEKSELMDESLWKYVADTAVDDITAGGWISSYSGKPFSKAEMDEYSDNILKKLTPLLHQKTRLLEIGCASGISMYRIAPRVDFYYGTDLSETIILKNKKRAEQEGHQNIHLSCVPAHDIDKIEEKNFDLIIINSVIQCFPGHNYLRKILYKAIGLMKEQGYIFIGDVMDQELKADLIRDLEAFKLANANKGEDYTTKTDFSSELFVSRGFFDNLSLEIPWIRSMEYSRKIGTIENELTRFRYDVLVSIDKTQTRRGTVKKYQQDLRVLENQGTEKVETQIGTHHIAYVIYTSGTAGQPKGVIIQHGSLVNLCFWHNRYYQVTERDRATQYAGFGFDASVWEIFPYLVHGAAIHIISDDIKLDTGRINDFYKSRGITISFLPTQLCEQFMEESNHSLRVLLTGGDKLNHFISQSYQLYNNYGPTENTVVTTAGLVEAYNDNIPIGKPIGNVHVYILNKNMLLLQPVGAAGELCIAGASLARGYLNDPEFTVEKFDHDLWDFQDSQDKKKYQKFFGESRGGILQKSTPSHRRLYKTGDLARWLADGNIEFLGRMDYQVKIRGYRIESGEIESRLIAHDDIKEAVVVDRGSEKGDSYLCAYIVPADTVLGGFDTAQLADFLAEKLPDYMIPTHFVQLGKIPLTLSGKVNRKALPVPEVRAAETFEPPQSEIERKVAAIWAEVLNIDENAVGKDSNFFQLGGHSLKGTILTTRIHKELGIKVPLAEIFNRSTIRELAQYIENASVEIFSPIEKAAEQKYYALSSAQKRLYILQQMDLSSTAYNIWQVVDMKGIFNKERFRDTFMKLIRRHESLRTGFHIVGAEPVQRVHKHVDFQIEYYKKTVNGQWSMVIGEEDSSRLPYSSYSFYSSLEDVIRNFIRPFDLSKAPLIRVGLIHTPACGYPSSAAPTSHQEISIGNSCILMVDMHHIVSDGVSLGLLVKEFTACYNGEELPVLSLHYKDYSEWQNRSLEKGELKAQETYWLKQFEEGIPVLDLPVDFAWPSPRSFEGSTLVFEIGPKASEALRQMASEQEVTLYMVLLSLYNVLLSKLSGQEDIVVGTPLAGRTHADLRRIIGMFVNTLALRNYPSTNKTFKEFLLEIKERTLKAFENQDYPFEILVQRLDVTRDLKRNPLFDVMFEMQNMETSEGRITGLTLVPYPVENRSSQFDLTLSALEGKDRLSLSFKYCTRLFKKETISRFIGYFKKILFSIIENPNRKLGEIEIIDEEEKKRIFYDFNDTRAAYPKDKTIHQLFEEQSTRTPDGVAVVGSWQLAVGSKNRNEETVQLTYSELNRNADQLAHVLRQKGVTTDAIVGLLMERSVEMIVSILGILKAGGAYLPINTDYPRERIDYMLTDSGAAILLTNLTSSTLSLSSAPKVLLNLSEAHHIDFLSSPLPRFLVSQPSNLAYVIYTSGTTGKPKGTMIQHHSLANRLNWMQKKYPLDESDTILHKTPFTFDVSVWEIFWWAIVGARVCLLAPGGEKDPGLIADTAARNRVTVMHFVPSMLTLFLGYLKQSGGTKKLSCLKQVIASGEALTVSQVNMFKKSLYNENATQLANLYGPTEATIDVSYFDCFQQDVPHVIPIGKPIDNICLYVLDKHLHIQPLGVTGELFIGGVGLSRGYTNRLELTAEKFDRDLWDFHDDHDDKKKGNYQKFFWGSRGAILQKSPPGRRRLYKTGDLARCLPDGNIEFLGRIDHQVKVRGFRIELGEIENRLLEHETIKETVVICMRSETEGSDKTLCACIVSDEKPDTAELRAFLSLRLPDYMVPSVFRQVNRIPLTSNGKVDRKALVSLGSRLSAGAGVEHVAPGTPTETRIAGIWREVLKLDNDEVEIGIHDNFFDIGGTSMDVIRVNAKVAEEFEKQIPIVTMYKYTTIRALSGFLDQGDTEDHDLYHQEKRVDRIQKGRSDRNKMRDMRQSGRT